jgi:hypothetical protein
MSKFIQFYKINLKKCEKARNSAKLCGSQNFTLFVAKSKIFPEWASRQFKLKIDSFGNLFKEAFIFLIRLVTDCYNIKFFF